MSEIKLCKSCEHYVSSPLSQTCMRPVRIPQDLATGAVTKACYSDCWSERRNSWFADRCGPKAKYWSPKPPAQE